VSFQEKLKVKYTFSNNNGNLAYFDLNWSKYHQILHYLLILVIFCKNLTIRNKKNFGQKIVVLAHSEECDVAKTSLCSILKHFEPIFIKFE
jgi:hypothetical protein